VQKLVLKCPPIELKLAKKAPKRSLQEADVTPVKKMRVQNDVIDLDAVSTSYHHQEEVLWLKCEHQLLKTTDKKMILKS